MNDPDALVGPSRGSCRHAKGIARFGGCRKLHGAFWHWAPFQHIFFFRFVALGVFAVPIVACMVVAAATGGAAGDCTVGNDMVHGYKTLWLMLRRRRPNANFPAKTSRANQNAGGIKMYDRS